MAGLIARLVSRLPQVRLLGLVRCSPGESLLGRCWVAFTTSTSGWLLDPSRYGCSFGTPQPVPGVFARLTETPMTVRRWAPSVGEHSDEILGGTLGLSADEIAAAGGAGKA